MKKIVELKWYFAVFSKNGVKRVVDALQATDIQLANEAFTARWQRPLTKGHEDEFALFVCDESGLKSNLADQIPQAILDELKEEAAKPEAKQQSFGTIKYKAM
jgi:hypothetical protein